MPDRQHKSVKQQCAYAYCSFLHYDNVHKCAIMLDGDPVPPPHKFLAHVYCGQMAGCIKMAFDKVAWAKAYHHTKWHLNLCCHLATRDMGRKLGAVPLWGGGSGSPSNTMCPGMRPTCVPSFILIRQTVWPQCTNVTDRTDSTDLSLIHI